jgi:hypothetical protein
VGENNVIYYPDFLVNQKNRVETIKMDGVLYASEIAVTAKI